MKIPSKGMVKYEVAAAKAKPADGGGRMTTLAVGEEGSGGGTTKAIGEEGGGATTMAVGEEGGGNGGGRATTLAVGEEGGGSGGGRATTMAVGEEGGGGGGGGATTQAVGEEGGGGGGGGATTQAVGEEGGGGMVTTQAVGEEGGNGGIGGGGAVTLAIPEDGGGGRMTTMAVGEETGGGGGQSTFTAKVTNLLSDKTINNEKNDYKAYGRPGPGGGAAPLFGQQFKFGKAEAVKLTKNITANYEPAAQKKILKEIFARSSTSMASKGTVALTRDAAAELNKLSKKLGLDLKFTFNQPRPIHPVG